MSAIIAVSSEGPTLDDAVDPRFGRAGGFVLVDPSGATSYIDNGASQAMAHGAGIETARRVAAAGATVLITGSVGPKAAAALAAAKVTVAQGYDNMTVGQAVQRYRTETEA